MNYFECCHYCVAPKRYPGCSSKCPEYATARAKFESDKARHSSEKEMRLYSTIKIAENKDRVAKKKRDFHPYRGL